MRDDDAPSHLAALAPKLDPLQLLRIAPGAANGNRNDEATASRLYSRSSLRIETLLQSLATADCRIKCLLERLVTKSQRFSKKHHNCDASESKSNSSYSKQKLKIQNYPHYMKDEDNFDSLRGTFQLEDHLLDELLNYIKSLEAEYSEMIDKRSNEIKEDEGLKKIAKSSSNQFNDALSGSKTGQIIQESQLNDSDFQHTSMINRDDDADISIEDTASIDTYDTDSSISQDRNDNDEKFCYCNNGSFGKMIACDNQDCKIEWFHFRCVNLKKTPSDKWFCPDCLKIKLGKIQ
ncbi:MAG: hypothetical protein MHMPM18_005161 [Marteilia pararefringens]